MLNVLIVLFSLAGLCWSVAMVLKHIFLGACFLVLLILSVPKAPR